MQFTQSRQFSGVGDPNLDTIDPAYKMFVLHVGTGVDVDYVILSETGAQWEAGTGQLAVGGGISRSTVTDNSLGTTAKVDFDVGRHLLVVLEKATATVGAIDAIDVVFDNATSGLAATNVQAAIDELAAASGGSGWYSRDHSMFDNWTGGALTTVTWTNNNKTGESTSGSNAHQFYSLIPFGGDGGKYYFEVVADTVNGNLGIGVTSRATAMLVRTPSGIYAGSTSDSFAYWHNGTTYNNNSATSGFSTFANGDVISIAIDSAAGKIWWAKNGTWEGSGNPSAGTNPQYTDTSNLTRQLHVHVSPYAANAKATLRGLSSEFGYTPPTGFIAPFD